MTQGALPPGFLLGLMLLQQMRCRHLLGHLLIALILMITHLRQGNGKPFTRLAPVGMAAV